MGAKLRCVAAVEVEERALFVRVDMRMRSTGGRVERGAEVAVVAWRLAVVVEDLACCSPCPCLRVRCLVR